MCDRFEFITASSFSCGVFSSPSESKNSHTAFSTGHADSHGPPPTSSQTSHWSYRRANTTTSTTPYFVYFLAGSIRPRSLLVVLQHLKPLLTLISASRPADLIIKEPSAPRSLSFSGQKFQSSKSTPTTFIITRLPTKHRAYEARRAASTRGYTGRRVADGYLSWNDGATYATIHSVSRMNLSRGFLSTHTAGI